jgi:hypothetical protein
MSSAKVNGFIYQRAIGLLYLSTFCHLEALGEDAMTRKKGEEVLASMRAGFATSSLQSTRAHVF